MTIPQLMNCPHMPNGHCLECTAKDFERYEALRAENERLKEEQAAYVVSDQAEWDELRTEVKRLKQQISAMHDAGLGRVDTGGTRLSESLAEIERLKAELAADRAAPDLLTALHEVKP